MARFSFAIAISLSSCAIRSKRSDNSRTRSTTRPSRVEVERINDPQAEIKTSGVIIAVRMDSTDDRLSNIRLPPSRLFSVNDCRKRKRRLSREVVDCGDRPNAGFRFLCYTGSTKSAERQVLYGDQSKRHAAA